MEKEAHDIRVKCPVGKIFFKKTKNILQIHKWVLYEEATMHVDFSFSNELCDTVDTVMDIYHKGRLHILIQLQQRLR